MDDSELILDNSTVFCDYGSREYSQKKHFGAKYLLSDILLTTLGGVLAVWLVHHLKTTHKR